ncbi:TetR/AcrR family transcriptional regulator [Nonomuraea sp. NPDC049400]|uniref:TetR/AcrR family transcriptional regulator n=1 Tax=Nonomuraea sp. NPDC049400 TaxID=3364352 RepID=UPI0037AC6228
MQEGLREHKKRQTRQRISEVAIGLFVERAFENVTIAEVASAAEVSVNTVYNYFESKEDLVVPREEASPQRLADIVRQCRPGESAAGAVLLLSACASAKAQRGALPEKDGTMPRNNSAARREQARALAAAEGISYTQALRRFDEARTAVGEADGEEAAPVVQKRSALIRSGWISVPSSTR